MLLVGWLVPLKSHLLLQWSLLNPGSQYPLKASSLILKHMSQPMSAGSSRRPDGLVWSSARCPDLRMYRLLQYPTALIKWVVQYISKNDHMRTPLTPPAGLIAATNT